MQVKTACPSCGAPQAIPLGRLPDSRWFAGAELAQAMPGGDLYRCDRCHLRFRFPILDSAAYRRLYDNSITGTWSATGQRPDWDRIADALASHVAPGGKILDFGCYSGGLLARLRNQYACYGIEINRTAADQARATSGAEIAGSPSELPPGLRFDAIVVADVIEHVADPVTLVRELLPLLADEGVMVISTGDAAHPEWLRYGANWWYCSYAEHIVFISRDWLEHLRTVVPVVVRECDNFTYRRLTPGRRRVEAAMMRFYGRLPRTYAVLKRLAQQLCGRRSPVAAPGNGVGADHMLIVLARNPNRLNTSPA